MSDQKRFRCVTCNYILEHDTGVNLPPCPECGEANGWELMRVKPAMPPVETGFAQTFPHDITEGNVSGLAGSDAFALPPEHDLAASPSTGSRPFARPEETGFSNILPPDMTERDAMPPTPTAGIDLKIDGYAFQAPRETGFDQIMPRDISEVSAMELALGDLPPLPEAKGPIVDPFARPAVTGFEKMVPFDLTERDAGRETMGSLKAADDPGSGLKLDEYAFRPTHASGFEQVVPSDFTEGDITRTVLGNLPIASDGPSVDTKPFARPDETGFEQVVPNDFTLGSAPIANLPPLEVDNPVPNEQAAAANPFARPEQTGFEQFIPTDINVSHIDSPLPASLLSGSGATSKRYRCDLCGAQIELSDEVEQLPPCPVCGGMDDWTLIDQEPSE